MVWLKVNQPYPDYNLRDQREAQAKRTHASDSYIHTDGVRRAQVLNKSERSAPRSRALVLPWTHAPRPRGLLRKSPLPLLPLRRGTGSASSPPRRVLFAAGLGQPRLRSLPDTQLALHEPCRHLAPLRACRLRLRLHPRHPAVRGQHRSRSHSRWQGLRVVGRDLCLHGAHEYPKTEATRARHRRPLVPLGGGKRGESAAGGGAGGGGGGGTASNAGTVAGGGGGGGVRRRGREQQREEQQQCVGGLAQPMKAEPVGHAALKQPRAARTMQRGPSRLVPLLAQLGSTRDGEERRREGGSIKRVLGGDEAIVKQQLAARVLSVGVEHLNPYRELAHGDMTHLA